MDNNDFLKSLSKSLIEATKIVLEGKTHTVPKTEKEKKLAALAEPKDKITHADVLKGRGVVKEEEMDGVAPGSMEDNKHMCATKVFHKEWKEGTPVKTMHADPDENGLIEWYDVMFDHGIERVMTEDMDILEEESHMHARRRMKKEEVEQIDELETATLKSYRTKARAQGNAIVDKMKLGGGDWSKDQRDTKTLRKRAAGAQASGKQLIKRGESLKTEEVEQERIDELSKDKMLKYLAANKKDDAKAREQGDMDKMTKRMRGTDMAVRKYTAKPGSKYVRVPATEEIEVEAELERIDEAMSSYDRYTSTHAATKNLLKSIGDHLDAHKKAAVAHKGYYSEKKGPTWGHVGDIDHIHSQLKDIHDRLAQQGEYAKENAAMREDVDLTEEEKALLEELNANFDEINAEIELDEARRGRPPKNAAAKTEEEPAALGYQLRKAASINKPVHFMNGERKEVAPGHIEKFNDHMAARKTAAEKAAFQAKAHRSHADFVKAVSEPVPHAKKDTGEIVKYR